MFLFCLEFMIKLKSGLKNLLGYLSNFDPPKKLAIFDPLPQATFFFVFGTIHLRRRHVLGGEEGSPLPMFADARG